jgi:UDP-N-acetylglucosamine 2-epimerase (non-hydrolysing)
LSGADSASPDRSILELCLRTSHIAAVVGTRPEAIKTAPVLHALHARGLTPTLVLTGQHPALDLAAYGLERFPRQ